jgi:hypothetical protein
LPTGQIGVPGCEQSPGQADYEARRFRRRTAGFAAIEGAGLDVPVNEQRLRAFHGREQPTTA